MSNSVSPYSSSSPRANDFPHGGQSSESSVDSSVLAAAQGVMFGQLIGDSLGSQVEFKTSAEISALYPDGVRELAGGGPFDLNPGQPTDDSEMALSLARSMVEHGGYDEQHVFRAYQRWAATNPPDIGNTCRMALTSDKKNEGSLANGALMRVSPLAIAYWAHPEQAGELAATDAALTHPHPQALAANRFYVRALAEVIGGRDAREAIAEHAHLYDASLLERFSEPRDFYAKMGWLDHALCLLVREVFEGESFEESLVRVVGEGGDTDTNAAIVGAFLGGMYGVESIPLRWRTVIEECVLAHARPQEFSPRDAAALAEHLIRFT